MSKVVFRNYDKKSIKELMKEIGKERFTAAVLDSGMESVPLTMEGFFIEYEPESVDFIFYYRYPSGVSFKLMSVLGFWAVPERMWVRERV